MLKPNLRRIISHQTLVETACEPFKIETRPQNRAKIRSRCLQNGARWRQIARSRRGSAPNRPKTAPRAPKIGPRDAKTAPKGPLGALSSTKMAPRWRQDGVRWRQHEPRWPQDGANMSQVGSNMAHQTRKVREAKTLKNQWFFKVFA